MNKLIYICFIGVLFSCSPQKRLNRLVKKHPELVKTDTITVRDTIRDTISIVTESVKTDTVFSLYEVHDTITITKDNLTIRYYHDTIHDSIYISGECDTIFVDVPYEKIVEYQVPCDKVIVKKGIDWWYWILLIIPILGFLYVLRELIRKR